MIRSLLCRVRNICLKNSKVKDVDSSEEPKNLSNISSNFKDIVPPSYKPKKVVIVGADHDLAVTVHVCISALYIPVGIYFQHGDSLPPQEIEVKPEEIYGWAAQDQDFLSLLQNKIQPLSEDEFLEIIKQDDIEIIAGSYGLRERNYFIKTLLNCRNKLNIQKPIKHPASLIDRLPVRSNGYICTGYQGSGNMVAQKILEELTKNTPIENDKLTDIAKNYAVSYWFTIQNLIEKYLYDFGLWHSDGSPAKEKYGVMYFNLLNYVYIISGFTMHGWMMNSCILGSHESATRSAIDFYNKINKRFVSVIRDPLDIIISCARKYTVEYGDDKQTHSVKWLIDQENWFCDILYSIKQYFTDFNQNRESILLIKYEDVITSPVETIKNIAFNINIEITTETAEHIWNNHIKEKKLSKDKGHLWDPRQYKWVEYIPVEYKDILEKSGIIELANNFGYEIDLNRLSRKKDNYPADYNINYNHIALEDFRWHSLTKKSISLTSSDVVILENNGIKVSANKIFEDEMRRLLDSKILKWLVESV